MAQVLNLAASLYFLKKLNTPFINTDAYRLGLIDKNGKRTRVPIVTPEQKKAFSYYDVMVNNLKRIIAVVPGGNSRVGRIAASLLLMREDSLVAEDEKLLEKKFYEYYDKVVQNEDGEPINNAGSGHVAGLIGEPPIRKKQADKYKRSNIVGEKKISKETAGLILTALGRRHVV